MDYKKKWGQNISLLCGFFGHHPFTLNNICSGFHTFATVTSVHGRQTPNTDLHHKYELLIVWTENISLITESLCHASSESTIVSLAPSPQTSLTPHKQPIANMRT